MPVEPLLAVVFRVYRTVSLPLTGTAYGPRPLCTYFWSFFFYDIGCQLPGRYVSQHPYALVCVVGDEGLG